MSAVVDGEVERYGAVATGSVTSGVGWCVGACIVGIAVPDKAVASSNSLVR